MVTDEPTSSELLALAMTAARRAGGLLAERVKVDRRLVETKSSLTDMVTEVDRESESLISTLLRAQRPSDAVLGEETGERSGTSRIRWVVDPLDGTTNFLYAFPAYAVSIAAERDGETVVGVVHDAVHGQTYHAVSGEGAFLDGRPIRVSGKRDLATALIGTGFGYRSSERAEAAALLTHVLPRVRDIRRSGSAALDLCWVACGRLDAFYERGLKLWDLAAGELIVREAGGITSDMNGERVSPGSVVAATPALHDPLVSLLRAYHRG